MRTGVEKAGGFVFVSAIGWCLDFAIFSLLVFLSVPAFWSNVAGSISGFTCAFFLGSHFVFTNNGKGSLVFKYCIFGLYQIALILTVSICVHILAADLVAILDLQQPSFCALISKVLLTPVSLLCNFFAMRFLVEFFDSKF